MYLFIIAVFIILEISDFWGAVSLKLCVLLKG